MERDCYVGGLGSRQIGRPRKTWKEIVDKDMNDLQIKPSDATDCSKWKKMSGGNWSDGNKRY